MPIAPSVCTRARQLPRPSASKLISFPWLSCQQFTEVDMPSTRTRSLRPFVTLLIQQAARSTSGSRRLGLPGSRRNPGHSRCPKAYHLQTRSLKSHLFPLVAGLPLQRKVMKSLLSSSLSVRNLRQERLNLRGLGTPAVHMTPLRGLGVPRMRPTHGNLPMILCAEIAVPMGERHDLLGKTSDPG